jgi:hypothetical protein
MNQVDVCETRSLEVWDTKTECSRNTKTGQRHCGVPCYIVNAIGGGIYMYLVDVNEGVVNAWRANAP